MRGQRDIRRHCRQNRFGSVLVRPYVHLIRPLVTGSFISTRLQPEVWPFGLIVAKSFKQQPWPLAFLVSVQHDSSTAAAQFAHMQEPVHSPEALLKASVIDRLIAARLVDEDAVIISEMVIADWTRRADVVLANGSLVAFEIKSEADSLTRLEGQMATFNEFFEKLILVVAPRFEERVMQLALDGVGVWVAEHDGLKERRRPKKRALSREAAIALMTVTDLKLLMSCNGVDRARDMPRRELQELAMQLPANDLANAARDAVKRRHRNRHAAFLAGRENIGTLAALPVLRRERKTTDTLYAQPEFDLFDLPEIPIADDNPLLVRALAGPVLKRRVTA